MTPEYEEPHDRDSSLALSTQSETCSSLTKSGKACRMRPLVGTDRCLAHSEGAVQRAKAAAKASAVARTASAEKRREVVETARIEAQLGVEYHINRLADERDAEIAEALVQRAIDNPDGRSMGELLNRRLGRVADRIELLGGAQTDPFEMNEEELWAWINSPDEPSSDD